jgi:hypothetical protein
LKYRRFLLRHRAMPALHRSPLAPLCVVVGGLLGFLAWTLLK